ncbi:DMT family transporter [Thaumasiovibrio subtropicus]|uniref:DMT family transporter n=1 Tax=Thaumasiovibrio subtropicus TaxID=1891207 RepID=UPI000B34B19E|nr:DMT family transporter [Thaumasiovibrio subtropicus]
MALFVLLALLNGCCIASSRILNGQLSLYTGVFKASLVNHFVGFGLLSLVVFTGVSIPDLGAVSFALYIGGAIGALYVALNSFVMVRLGATQTVTLVISGQMLTSLLLDGTDDHILLQLLGVGLIVLGAWIRANESS